MRLRSSEAASELRVSVGVMPWLSVLVVLLAIGCTEPSFVSEPKNTNESDGGDRSEIKPDDVEPDDGGVADTGTEQPDSGSAPRDGEQPVMTERCDGGACPAVDAQTPSIMPETGAPDSGSDAGPVLDDVRATWAGLYAARTAMFGIDAVANATIRVLSIIEIVPTPEGGLRLEEQLCDYVAQWQQFGVSGAVSNRYGDARSSAALQYDGQRFSTEQLALRTGYGAAPLGCSPGATVMRQAHQPWLSEDTCDCPRSNDIPTSVRDCRLTDPEKDKQPGASLSGTLGATQYVFRVAQELRTTLVEGYRHNGRLYADRWFEETTQLLNCTIDGQPAANSRCGVTPYRGCLPRHNKVEMVKLDGPLECAQVIARESALFLSPLPSFPAVCASELAATPKP